MDTTCNYANLKASDWFSISTQTDWFDRLRQDDLGIGLTVFENLIQNLLPPDAKREKFNQDQVRRLFEIFDTNNDQLIDLSEFSTMCENWLHKIFRPNSALIIVDVQNDFIGGSLALINGPARQDGKEVVPIINDILKKVNFDLVVYTHDWHPVDHIAFYENLHMRDYSKTRGNQVVNNGSSIKNQLDDSNELKSHSNDDSEPKKKSHDEQQDIERKAASRDNGVSLFDTVYFNGGEMEQILWPRHCVQNSWGSQLDDDLIKVDNCIKIYKGTLPDVDAYSVFWDNQRLNETKLANELISRQITDVFICGLAIDYCVSASAIDAAQYGFLTFVIQDACRGIDPIVIERRSADMLNAGVIITDTKHIYEEDKFKSANLLFKRAVLCEGASQR